MLRYIIWTLVIYGLVRLIFNFIIPVFRATKQMKTQVKEFQDRMQSTGNPYASRQPQTAPAEPPSNNKNKAGDYIDFEEVRR